MMLAQNIDFTGGKDRRGSWTAVAAGGLAGGFFVSHDAALHHDRLETGRRPGAVQEVASPIRLTLGRDRVGPQGEGMPAWWRHAVPARESRSYSDGASGSSLEGKGWLMLDIGIAIGFALICLATAVMMS